MSESETNCASNDVNNEMTTTHIETKSMKNIISTYKSKNKKNLIADIKPILDKKTNNTKEEETQKFVNKILAKKIKL